MKLQHKLIAIAALPLALALIYAAQGIGGSFATRSDAIAVTRAVDHARETSLLIHMLQRERGASAGYVASKGRNFSNDVGNHRREVDAARATFTANANDFPEYTQSLYSSVEGKLAQLDRIRSRVDNLSAPVSEVGSTYTGIITDLIQFTHVAIGKEGSPRVIELGEAYLDMIQAKEYAGQERAAGASGFGAGAFTSDGYTKFVSLGAKQTLLFGHAQERATPADARAITDLQGGASSRTVEAYRARARESVSGAQLQNISGGQWFAASTQRIDDMKRVEEVMSDSLMAEAKSVASASTTDLLIGSLVSLFAVMGSLFVSLFMARNISRPLAHISGAMKKISDGALETKIPAAARKDEIGGIARALKGFRDELAKSEEARREARQLREEAEETQKKRMAEQEFVVSSLADGLKRLSHGDLKSTLDESFSDEFEPLRNDFNATVKTLRATIETIVDTVTGIRHGSAEISTATDDLSKRTEGQAASLEQTAAALDEITSTVKQTSEGANEASSVAAEMRVEVTNSGEIVKESVDAMAEIEQSSTKISQIIGVIDDIAFQTNLLALNAGVEAARAGEAGRGFAVVAQEVRALAQRSSDAAREIKGLITASSQHVEIGVDRVARAGTALEEIVNRVESVASLVSEIAASAKEQSTSLSEVNSAVNKMDQVTQQNASMVEETTAASRTLATDADQLMSQVSHFETGEEVAPAQKRPVRKPAAAPDAVLAEQRQRISDFAQAANGSVAVNLEADIDDQDWTEF